MDPQDHEPAHAIDEHRLRTALTVAHLNLTLLNNRLRRQTLSHEEILEIVVRIDRAHRAMIALLAHLELPNTTQNPAVDLGPENGAS